MTIVNSGIFNLGLLNPPTISGLSPKILDPNTSKIFGSGTFGESLFWGVGGECNVPQLDGEKAVAKLPKKRERRGLFWVVLLNQTAQKRL